MEKETSVKNSGSQERGKRPYPFSDDKGEGSGTRHRKISSVLDLQGPELSRPDPECFARRYQLDVLYRAREENTIAYLDTGAGKTLIAIMLIRHYAHLLRKPQSNIAIFMVPTVVLVQQQADVLEIHTDLKVGRFWGAMGVDLWDRKKWQEQLDAFEVFVMTPQIFLDNLRHCFFKLESVKLMIFDECHHARKKNPYACIMNEFYHRIARANGKDLPRIFGMTASPVYSKGISSPASCAAEVWELENILNAKVYTLDDTSELEAVLSYPELKIKFYDHKDLPHNLLQNLRRELENVQYKHTKFMGIYEIDAPTHERARRKIGKLHLALLFCAEEMGLWCAAKASEILLNTEVGAFKSDATQHEFIVKSKKCFLQDAWSVCHRYLPSDKLWRCGVDLAGDVRAGFVSSKVQCLIHTLLEYRDGNQLRCIVFVRRVIAAMVVGSLLSQLDCFSCWKSEFMAGNQSKLHAQTRNQQKQIVDAFREGTVNITVATQILEEGLDIQGCNLVIRFDLSDTICSFIQSRGRARMQGSHYLLLVKRGDGDQKKQLDSLLASEQIMREEALHRMHIPSGPHVSLIASEEIYCVESTGAIVTLNSSVALVYYYCSQLPRDRYYTPRPHFHVDKGTGICILELPTNCPITRIEVEGNINLLKPLACLEACKQLHEVGALTDYLLPEKEEEEEEQIGDENKENKVLHPLYAPKELVGDWDLGTAKLLFHCYHMSFERNFLYEFPFRNVLLLAKHAFDPTVANVTIHLETTKGSVTVQTQFGGILELDADKVEIARKFQVTILRLLMDHKLDKLSEAFSSHYGKEKLKSPFMYLLLPLLNNTACQELNASMVDWMCIRKASFSENLISSFGLVEGDYKKNGAYSCERSSIVESNTENLIHTACGVLPVDMLPDSIAFTAHNGMIYSILNILWDLNANCIFPSEKSLSGDFGTYSQYFKTRYGIRLNYQAQPLLCAKPLFTVRNLLLRRPHLERDPGRTSTVELPPELCKIVCCGISTSTLYTFSLIPSIMHRIESMLSAAHLQNTFLNQWPSKFSIPTIKVLEALTRKKCQECMSLETLETLGDAFLKYVASRNVFTTYTQQHEGQLTSKRKHIISNYALYKIGCTRQIPGYIRNERFDPERWTVPGQVLALSSGLFKDISCSENLHIKEYRLMSIKDIADVVEALIGAYLDAGGEIAALNFMGWLGISINFLAETPITKTLDTGFVSSVNIHYLETLLHYTFRDRGLLVEALTHASYQGPLVSGCYQRLEFLGDAVLDYLITSYLYKRHPGLSPGVLTDLKSAAVNNDCYAQAAVKCGLHRQLHHASSVLHRQITDFVKVITSCSTPAGHLFGWTSSGSAVPKVLGDLIESIAGAILVDSGFETELVWNAIKPLLEPIVTPDTLCFHPVRALQELCQKKIYTLSFDVLQKEGTFTVEVKVGAGDVQYVETCEASNKKTGKKLAAEKVLRSLEALNSH
eukprot:Gb_32044 [translate_table: standard]